MTASAHRQRRIGYVFPWDVLGDPDAFARWRSLGIDELAIAASYHETRAATPLHPDHRFVDVEHAAFYGRRRSWHGALEPAWPSWIGDDAFGRAREAARDAGFPVTAWIVLTHNDVLGARHPELCVTSAWGDRYPWALCPTAASVVEYCTSIVVDVIESARPEGVVLESAGPMGVDHRGAYDKTDLAGWTLEDRRLLSLCFCEACREAYRDGGLDPETLAGVVRGSLGAGGAHESATLDRAFEIRLERSTSLLTQVVTAARALDPALRIAVHASADPRAAGPFPPVDRSVASILDVLVASGWVPEAAAPQLAALGELAPGIARGLYVRPEFPIEQLAALDPQPDELHLYHLGLSGPTELAALGRLGRRP